MHDDGARHEQRSSHDGIVSIAPFADRDIPAMMSWNRDREAQRWFDWPAEPLPDNAHEAQCRTVIENWHKEWIQGTRAAFAVRAGDRTVGSVEVRSKDGCGHVSYLTHPDWRARGYATRAVRLVSKWAFAAGFEKLVIEAAEGNTASRRVAEAAGFLDSGHREREVVTAFVAERGEARTLVRYTLTKPA